MFGFRQSRQFRLRERGSIVRVGYVLVVTGAMLFSVRRDCKARHRGVGAADSTLIAQDTKRERKGIPTLVTRTQLQQALAQV